jgi:hypothetical protein
MNWIDLPSLAAREILNAILFDYRYLPVYILLMWFIKARHDRYMSLRENIYGTDLKAWKRIIEEVVLFGLVIGYLLSLVSLGTGVTISVDAVKYLLIIAVVLGIINIRLVRFSYAAAILVLIGAVFNIGEFANPGLLIIAAVLNLIEGILIRLNTHKDIFPIFIKHETQIAGAFLIRKFWIFPIVFFTFASGQELSAGTLQYTSGIASALALDCILGFAGYSDIAISKQPEIKIRETSRRLIIANALLLLTTILSFYVGALLIIASILLIIVNEGIMFCGYSSEKRGEPLFVSVRRGLKVFDVLPGSHAQKMGIMRGDTILGINGKDIQTEQGLSEALKDYPSFVWVHIKSAEGEDKTYSYRAYPEGFKNMGIVFVPREKEVTYNVDNLENLVIIRNLVARFKGLNRS